MTLPQLRGTAPVERGSISLASSPLPPSPVQRAHSTAFPSACEVLHLPVLTATSLRPARQSKTTHAMPHPLLDALLSNPRTPTHESPPIPTLLSPSVQDAIEEVGGADRVEALLQRLHDLPHTPQQQQQHRSGDVASSPAVCNAVHLCVQDALDLPPDAVHVSCAEDDASTLHVRIPLRVPAPSAPGVVAPRPCLVLRVHRQRGVLALHIVDLRYDGAVQRLETRVPGVAVAAAAVKRKRGPGGRSARTRPAAIPQVTTPLTVATRDAQPLAVQPGPPSSSSAPSTTKGLDFAQLSSMIVRAPATRSGIGAGPAITNKAAPTSSKPSPPFHETTGTAPRTRSVRQTRKRHTSARRSHSGGKEDVEFDPLHPEATTPFDAQHRPLTFNAAIAFAPRT